jgi:hypothetical protein
LFTADADRLLVALDDGDPALSTLYDVLEQLAVVSGVRRFVVAIDDPHSGRQFFASDRRRFSSSLAMACGASVWTEPPIVIAPDLQSRLVASVGAAFRRACQPPRSATADWATPDGATAEGATPGGPTPAGAMPGGPTPAGAMPSIRAAAARATRYGWNFTLVCVAGPFRADRLPGLRASLRSGDSVVATGDAELVLILESARDEEVPAILARLAARDDLPGLSFGLVHCPGDGSDPEDLMGQARLRLADALARVRAPSLRAAGAR